jgi:hypothetical protein
VWERLLKGGTICRRCESKRKGKRKRRKKMKSKRREGWRRRKDD